MKKALQFICMGFVALLFCEGIALLSSFPVDTQPYVEKKYSGWNGVIQAWIYTKWNPDGSFIRWLNSCASKFEKAHDGIYLEFIPVQEEPLQDMGASGIPVPDLIFFSPGVITNHNMLSSLEDKAAIRDDLKNYGNGKAVPVAIGGYVWAYNTSLVGNAPRTADELSSPVLPEDVPYATLIGLLSGAFNETSEEMDLPDSGLNLGLPTSAGKGTLHFPDATDRFIEGELSCIPVDARALGRLGRLRESGKGPAWSTAAAGELTCTDQILLAAVPVQETNLDRAMLAEEFISFLLEEEAQDALAGIGAFSVTGRRIHSDFSIYSEMDAMLNHLPLWLPDCFSEYSISNSDSIVRRFLRGEISAKNALNLLGFEEV